MAQNTRSKNSRKFAHTAQLEAHTSLTDEAIVAETYSDNSKSPPDQGLTKRTKIDTVLDETSSEPKVNNDMDIDKNLEKENVVPSNSDAESRDSISADQQTPINTESDDMITDLPNKDTNGATASGSSNTQNTQRHNNDEITRSILIFKENTSTTNCQYFIFFTKDQFDANKSNNEIINSIKNAFLTIHHAIGYKYQKKATLEFFTVQINNEECYNNIVDKPIALLNNLTPRPYSKDLIDQLIAAKLNKIEECTVKLANVPFNYDVNLLIKHFANYTKQSIASFKEIKPNLKRRRPLDNRNTQRSQSPTYKQVIITFDKKSAVDYLFAQHKWGILIENFLVRILPIDVNSQIHKQRNTPTYVVTGIPLNANILDLEPLITHVKGRSLAFVPTNPNSLHKVAYIYTDCNIDDQSSIIEKFDTPFNGAKLFIFPASQKKYTETCGYCGDDNHMINDCKETDYVLLPNNRGRRFRKKFLARSNKFTMDDSNKSIYNRIRIITRSTPNEHNLNHNGPNQSLHSKPQHPNSTKYNYNQTQYQQPRHGKNINNTQSIPHGSWARPSEESGPRYCSKTHNKDIKLLQEQERRHAKDIEKIRVECEKTNTTITKQSEIISDIPEMASILRNINNSGILTRFQPEQEAYGTHNYAHPPHNLYVEEHVHQQEEIYSEYEDSNNGYESSETINTRIFPDDDNYTPSHPTSSSFPSITSRGGLMMNNNNNKHTSGIENQKFSPFSKIKHLISSKNPFKNTKKTSKSQNQKNNINNIDNTDTPQITQHSYPTLIFATHNIQGSLNQKRDILLLYMMEHDIDCLFICETNIVDPNFSPTLKTAWQKIIAPIYNNSNNIFYFINNPDLEHRGSDSTFILTEKLHRHLQTTKILDHGRCIKITLNFKNHKIFNIYGIYLPSGKDKSNEHIKKTRLNNICKILFDDITKQNHVTTLIPR
ncbi:unnamed protein product [Rhizophagus irregularis]|nr:unnamed protein product [Rhizophagus irregularis]